MHTQGPWKATEYSEGSDSFHVHRAANEREQVADDIHSAADARLIAAAPDLLIACQEVLASDSINLCDCGEANCATTRLRAAVAKAIGR